MRVLMSVQFYFPFQDRGGPVLKVRALARGLAQRGHAVTVLTADLGLRGFNGALSGMNRSRWGWRSEMEGVEAIYLPTLGRYRALTFNPRVVRFCGAHLRDFDLVHFYGLYDLLGPAVSYFCRRSGIPYVIEPLGMYRPIERSVQLKHLWHRTLGGAFWRNAARIVATSELEEQELLDDGVPPGKVVVRYNGIDLESFASLPPRGGFRAKWSISPREPLILFFGRLIPRKGADTLIEAFSQTCPSTGFLVIAGPEGESGYRAYLEKCARERGVEGRVRFTGALYNDEKKAALADADLFVLPSRYENFANAAAEAIACGVPVIVTQSCGIRSLVNGRAGLVIGLGVAPLAEALRKLMDDKAQYAALRRGCRDVADQLRWERLTEQMETYYQQILGPTHAVN
ncbi:MAG TPA: glycosyltransferase [archaeon]|nr:glycosyltransferase [archaeon]